MALTKLTAGTNNTALTNYRTEPITPTPDSLVVVFVMSGSVLGPSVSPTITSQQGLPFTRVSGIKHPGTELRLECFRAMPTSAVGAGTLTFDFGVQAQRWCGWTVYEFDGVVTDNLGGVTAVGDVKPGWVSGSTTFDTTLALKTRTCVAAVAIDRAATNIQPGAGAVGIDHLDINTILSAGRLYTQERPPDELNPSARWTWNGVANAVGIAIGLNVPPTVPPPIDPDEELIKLYEPVLFLDPSEKYAPVDAKRYLEHCRLWTALDSPGWPPDRHEHWNGGPAAAFPRKPTVEAGSLSGLPDEPGTFVGAKVDESNTEYFLELGGWRDADGTHYSGVEADSLNTYADGEEVARRYRDDAELTASKFWYHAEIFKAPRIRALLATVRKPDLATVLRDVTDPTLVCYYLFFPYHHQDGQQVGCESSTSEQLVGSCGGEWACVAVLLDRLDVELELAPKYIGYTGHQLALNAGQLHPYVAHHFDDHNRVNMNVQRWATGGMLTEGGHPRVHVAAGSHALSLRPGEQLGAAFHDSEWPTQCGEFDSFSLLPKSDDGWGDEAIFLAKILLGGPIGLVAAGIEAYNIASLPEATLRPDPPVTEYPEAGAGLTIRPKGLDVLDAGPNVEDWRSQQGLFINNRKYDYIVNRATQKWWPSDPTNPIATGFSGRWGPRVDDDPLSRRAGMVFPDFWKTFFFAVADGLNNKTFPP